MSYKNVSEYGVLPEGATRVASKSVRQERLTRVSHKSVPQECPAGECHKRVTQDCPTRLSEKSVKQDCSARVVSNAIEHLLFAFHCYVGTLLLRELLNMHSGSWFLSGLVLCFGFFLDACFVKYHVFRFSFAVFSLFATSLFLVLLSFFSVFVSLLMCFF